MYYLKTFGVSLLLTLIIENAAAFCIGERGRRTVLLVCLVNILTNPPVVLLYLLLSRRFPDASRFCIQLPPELLVLMIEALVYRAFSAKKGDVIRRPGVLSLIGNVCSYGTGLLIHLWYA